MHAKELIKYIRQPELLSRESIPELQKLVNDFPYFQTGHILLSLAAKRWDSAVYQQCIKKTAIVVNNREHLYKLISRPETEFAETVEEKQELPSVEKTDAGEKIAEALTEVIEQKKEEALPVKQITPVTEEQVEQEIGRSLVSAIVEKELLSEALRAETAQEKSVEKKVPASNPSSFSDWLQFLKKNNGEPYHEIAEKVQIEKEKRAAKTEERSQSDKQKKKALIDKIIETNPGAIRAKDDQKFFRSDQKARESLLENEHLVTETLAQIYALQGQTSKAIRAYEILSLRHPHKASHYAGLIARLKDPD